MQGVGFRWHTRLEARSLAVAGWVTNLADGAVEAHIEGHAGDVQALVEWMRVGPSGAAVEDLAVRAVEPVGDTGFEIR